MWLPCVWLFFVVVLCGFRFDGFAPFLLGAHEGCPYRIHGLLGTHEGRPYRIHGVLGIHEGCPYEFRGLLRPLGAEDKNEMDMVGHNDKGVD